jgi:hypothetical protein
MAPFFLLSFFSGLGYLRGDAIDDIKRSLRRDYVPVLLNNYKVGPLF